MGGIRVVTRDFLCMKFSHSHIYLINICKGLFFVVVLRMFRCICTKIHKFFCFPIGFVSKINVCIMMQSNLQIFCEFVHSIVSCISGCHLSKPDVFYITVSCISIYLKLNCEQLKPKRHALI